MNKITELRLQIAHNRARSTELINALHCAANAVHFNLVMQLRSIKESQRIDDLVIFCNTGKYPE